MGCRRRDPSDTPRRSDRVCSLAQTTAVAKAGGNIGGGIEISSGTDTSGGGGIDGYGDDGGGGGGGGGGGAGGDGRRREYTARAAAARVRRAGRQRGRGRYEGDGRFRRRGATYGATGHYRKEANTRFHRPDSVLRLTPVSRRAYPVTKQKIPRVYACIVPFVCIHISRSENLVWTARPLNTIDNIAAHTHTLGLSSQALTDDGSTISISAIESGI
jgi:hypothetical protein